MVARQRSGFEQGIDVPEAEVAIIVGSTQGERQHVQRIGRLLRPSPGKRATVYELVTVAKQAIVTSDPDDLVRLDPSATLVRI